MPDPTNKRELDYDLVGTLRKWAEQAKQQEVAHAAQGLQDAADEIDCLRSALAAAIKERDEARRELCREIANDRAKRSGIFDARRVAIELEWDCFAEGVEA